MLRDVNCFGALINFQCPPSLVNLGIRQLNPSGSSTPVSNINMLPRKNSFKHHSRVVLSEGNMMLDFFDFVGAFTYVVLGSIANDVASILASGVNY